MSIIKLNETSSKLIEYFKVKNKGKERLAYQWRPNIWKTVNAKVEYMIQYKSLEWTLRRKLYIFEKYNFLLFLLFFKILIHLHNFLFLFSPSTF